MRGRRLVLGLAGLMGLWSLGVASSVGAQTPPVVTSDPPLPGTVGSGYLHQFQTSPLSPAPTFSVTEGALPPGIALTQEGFLNGVPTSAGTFGPTTVCANNGVAPSACQTFTMTVLRRTPGVLAAASPGGPVGTPVRDTATLVGAFSPTGTVTFRLYSDEACTVEVFSSEVVVTTDGTATSEEFIPASPGTYRWTASYSGDANNNAVAAACDPGNAVTITGTTTTTSPPTSTSTSTSTTSTTSTSVPPTSTSTSSTSTTLPPGTTTTSPATTTSSTTSTSTTSTVPPTGTTSSSTTSSSTTSSSSSSTSTSSSTSITTSTTALPTSTSTSSTIVLASTSTTAATSTTSTSTTSTTTTVPASTTTTTTTTVPASSTTSTSTSTTVPASTSTSTTAPPAPAPPSVQATPQQVAPGENVTVTGSGFPPGRPVVAELFSDPVVLGTTTVDDAGAFRLVVTIPATTAPGLHTLRVRTADGTVLADTTLAVVAPVLAPAAVSTAGKLSRTGGDVTAPAGVALALVVAGCLLVVVSWKGRSPWPRR